MKKILCLYFALTATLTSAAPTLTPKAPSIAASGYILMDYQSGQVLVEHNADEQLPPASLTKIMTSYVAAYEIKTGNISSEDTVLISENSWAKNFPGSSLMFIEVGKEVKFNALRRGVIIQSGNDASVAVAEHVAGAEDSFADLMNRHAERLQLSHSHFVNSTGLPAENHYSSARDMALLGRALIHDFPEEYKIYAEKEFSYNGIKQYNRNSLLWDGTLGVDGIKTGHTEAAGYCLVSSAMQNGMRLIAVVMGTKSMKARKLESKKLLTYGFRYYETSQVVEKEKVLTQERIWQGMEKMIDLGVQDDIYLTLRRGTSSSLVTKLNIQQPLQAPLTAGQTVGSVDFVLADEIIHTAPLTALKTVAEGGWWRRFSDSVSQKINTYFE